MLQTFLVLKTARFYIYIYLKSYYCTRITYHGVLETIQILWLRNLSSISESYFSHDCERTSNKTKIAIWQRTMVGLKRGFSLPQNIFLRKNFFLNSYGIQNTHIFTGHRPLSPLLTKIYYSISKSAWLAILNYPSPKRVESRFENACVFIAVYSPIVHTASLVDVK